MKVPSLGMMKSANFPTENFTLIAVFANGIFDFRLQRIINYTAMPHLLYLNLSS